MTDWLENKWVTPAYGGWVLIGLSICFLAAAVNTMAGWLYVISGLSLALLVIAAIVPARSLLGISVKRYPIQPVSAGDELTIEIELINQTTGTLTLLQATDVLPHSLSQPVPVPIETIPSQATYRWVYYHPTTRRGIYHWQTVQLRTATPLGLFWCRRQRDVPVKAIVYPTVLPLSNCPIVDAGQEDSHQSNYQQRSHLATQGMTRSLRPYRMGDPTRLIHWRTSARYGELRVRELEINTSGQEIIIALNNATAWQEDNFEQAVIVAASLYFYAQRQQLNVKLWTAIGLVQGERAVLETLAATEAGQGATTSPPMNSSVIWLSQDSIIASGSRLILWQTDSSAKLQPNPQTLVIYKEQPLQLQLQQLAR